MRGASRQEKRRYSWHLQRNTDKECAVSGQETAHFLFQLKSMAETRILGFRANETGLKTARSCLFGVIGASGGVDDGVLKRKTAGFRVNVAGFRTKVFRKEAKLASRCQNGRFSLARFHENAVSANKSS